MEFVKAHGTGNDFVLLPDLGGSLELTAAATARLCAPHTGLGADGVIRIAPSRGDVDADVFMDYRNADGTLAEMCGNGVRTVAKYVLDRGLVSGETLRVDTRGGVKTVEVVDRDTTGNVAAVRVDMGVPDPLGRETLGIESASGVAEVDLTLVSMGNPHAVIVTDDVAAAPVDTLGQAIAQHPRFSEGTNVEFISVTDVTNIEGRIWERGVGETMSSGTGTSAMAVAACVRGLTERVVDVHVPGGTIAVDWSGERLYVTGSAVEVASGTISEAWLEASAPAIGAVHGE